MSLAVKSGRPLSREGLVQRPRLLNTLTAGRDIPLVVLVAPAGYGKTTLIAHWLAEDERLTTWLSLEDWHNDPLALTHALCACLEDAESPDVSLSEALLAPEPSLSSSVLPALADALEALEQPHVFVLDDVHLLTSPRSLQVLTTVAEHLPLGSQLILASRTHTALPLGRLRAHRSLLELGATELAMTAAEAALLLSSAGIRLPPADLTALVERTEGWPAGLFLAALSSSQDANPPAALARLAGSDHLIADYFRDEFLTCLSPEDLRFLVCSSVVELLSGPLCDALLQRTDSTSVLDRLAAGPLPLEPTGPSHDSYRCHRLLRELLLHELRHTHPELQSQLHLRAIAFHLEHGELDAAIAHAVAAHDPQVAGDLLWEYLPRYVTEGRNPLVQSWLANFSAGELSQHPSLALTAAHSALALGDIRRAEHWGLVGASALARATTPPKVSSLPTGIAVIEAAVGRHGVTPMGLQAARAYQLEDDDSPWRSICCLFQGVADHLTGDRAQAREHLEDGIHRSAVAAPGVETLCLSQLAMITVEEGDWDRGCDLIARAVTQVERHGLASYPTSALTFAVSADLRSHVGRVDEGKRDARRAAHLLPRFGDFIPWYEAETRIMLARAALRLADIGAARTLLAEASQLARRVPDAVLFGGWIEETWGLVDSAATTALAGPSTLTMAELRILRFLPTHLSFREIGDRLHVSTNTVKTQAHAVYRKLDVSSRSGAVSRAAEIGLLDT
jgi:LuxR family maltose regulon positive regulatory protein